MNDQLLPPVPTLVPVEAVLRIELLKPAVQLIVGVGSGNIADEVRRNLAAGHIWGVSGEYSVVSRAVNKVAALTRC